MSGGGLVKRDWKPGDVAMVTECGDPIAAVWTEDCTVVSHRHLSSGHWHYLRPTDGGKFWTSNPFAAAHPLILIDPEDPEQVDALCKALVQEMYRAGDEHSAANGVHPATMVAALRNLTTTPKPEEPTGLGAVVEDAGGSRWVRRGNPTNRPWSPEGTPGLHPWSEVDAVKVLSDGVTP